MTGGVTPAPSRGPRTSDRCRGGKEGTGDRPRMPFRGSKSGSTTRPATNDGGIRTHNTPILDNPQPSARAGHGVARDTAFASGCSNQLSYVVPDHPKNRGMDKLRQTPSKASGLHDPFRGSDVGPDRCQGAGQALRGLPSIDRSTSGVGIQSGRAFGRAIS